MIYESSWGNEHLNANPHQEILNTFTHLEIPLSGYYKGAFRNPQESYEEDIIFGDNLLRIFAKATSHLSRPYNIPYRFEMFGTNAMNQDLRNLIGESDWRGYSHMDTQNHHIKHASDAFYKSELAGLTSPQKFRWESARIFFDIARQVVFPLGRHPSIYSFDSTPAFDNKPIIWGICNEAENRFLTAIGERNIRVIVDDDNTPLLLQKFSREGSIDDPQKASRTNHTALLLKPMTINDAYCEPGMLMGATPFQWLEGLRDEEIDPILSIHDITQVIPLRPTLFMFPTDERCMHFPKTNNKLRSKGNEYGFGDDIFVDHFIAVANDLAQEKEE